MLAKIVAIVSVLALPLSASLWLSSHRSPQHRRYDVTPYKSLRIYLKDGVCGLRLLSMPTKTNFKSEFRGRLEAAGVPKNQAWFFSTQKSGPYRVTWVVLPLWVSTLGLLVAGTVLPLADPLRRWRRRRNGWCQECGYDLRGSRSGRCSECGSHFRRRQPRASATRRRPAPTSRTA